MNPYERPYVQAIGVTDENDRYTTLDIVADGLTPPEWQAACLGYLVGQVTPKTDTAMLFEFIGLVEGGDPVLEESGKATEEYFLQHAMGWAVYRTLLQVAKGYERFVTFRNLAAKDTYVG